MKFTITDDLPDLGNRVPREEILILLAIAPSLSPILAEAVEAATEPVREEVLGGASRPLRSRQHAEAS